MSDTPPSPPPDADRGEPTALDETIENFVLPYFSEPVLWPVLAALLGHVVVLFALPLIRAWQTGSMAWGAVVFLLVAICGWPVSREIARKGRPGAITVAIAATWVGSFIVAAIGAKYDVF